MTLLNSKPELLTPAGGIENVYAAVENGCSAVYAGGLNFSARQNAKNFTIEDLERAVNYCHLRGVKLFVAANTLVKDNELNKFIDLVESIYLIGADGVIVQDIGAAALIKKYFPDFYLSASTQMTTHDLDGAEFLRKSGFDRIILSRELSVGEISNICMNSSADIECFIHGALCVSFSGQCLMSFFNGGRSGNRGACAQPCRMPYKLLNENAKPIEGGVLSPKDMMGLYALPALIECGVNSFKIEGRMKSPEYVAGVTSIYRKYIDLYYKDPESYFVDEKDVDKLAAMFSRSGFNKGYFFDYSGKHMMTDVNVGNTGVYVGKVSEYEDKTVRFKTTHELSPGDGIEISGLNAGAYITKNYKEGTTAELRLRSEMHVRPGAALYRTYDKVLMDELSASYGKSKRKIEISGNFRARLEANTSFCVQWNNIRAEAFAEPPEKARNNATTSDIVIKQLSKTGNTPFVFDKIDVEMDGDLFINIAELNKLRRNALFELENKIIANSKRKNKLHKPYLGTTASAGKATPPEITVLVRTSEQLLAASEYSFSRLYVDFNADNEIINAIRKRGIIVYRCLERLQRDLFKYEYIGDFDGYLARTYGQIEFASQNNYAIDYSLNVFNSYGTDFWTDKNCKSVCVSPELADFEVGQLQGEVEAICYGKIPLMTTVQCPVGNFYGKKGSEPFCKNKNRAHGYTISNGKSYDLLPVCDKCYCLILSSSPFFRQSKFPCKYNRLEFSNETYTEAKKIISSFLGYSNVLVT